MMFDDDDDDDFEIYDPGCVEAEDECAHCGVSIGLPKELEFSLCLRCYRHGGFDKIA